MLLYISSLALRLALFNSPNHQLKKHTHTHTHTHARIYLCLEMQPLSGSFHKPHEAHERLKAAGGAAVVAVVAAAATTNQRMTTKMCRLAIDLN